MRRDVRRHWSALMFYFIFVIGTAIVSGLLVAATSFILFKMVFLLMILGILLGMFMMLGIMFYEEGVSFEGFYNYFKKHWDRAMGRDECGEDG